MSNLSDRQRHILEFIIDFVNDNEFPPTIREIGEQVGISSTSVVNYNLAKLEELGLIYASQRSESWPESQLGPDPGVRAQRIRSGALLRRRSSRVPWMRSRSQNRSCVCRFSGRSPPVNRFRWSRPNPVTTDDWVELPQGVFRSSDSLFALRVKGDSMIDASVLDGDVVILRHQETANDGDMVAAWIEGDEETTLKYLFREGRQRALAAGESESRLPAHHSARRKSSHQRQSRIGAAPAGSVGRLARTRSVYCGRYG